MCPLFDFYSFWKQNNNASKLKQQKVETREFTLQPDYTHKTNYEMRQISLDYVQQHLQNKNVHKLYM